MNIRDDNKNRFHQKPVFVCVGDIYGAVTSPAMVPLTHTVYFPAG